MLIDKIQINGSARYSIRNFKLNIKVNGETENVLADSITAVSTTNVTGKFTALGENYTFNSIANGFYTGYPLKDAFASGNNGWRSQTGIASEFTIEFNSKINVMDMSWNTIAMSNGTASPEVTITCYRDNSVVYTNTIPFKNKTEAIDLHLGESTGVDISRIFFDSPSKNSVKDLRFVIKDEDNLVEYRATDLVDVSATECTGKFVDITGVEHTFSAIASSSETGYNVINAFQNGDGWRSSDNINCVLDIRIEPSFNLYSVRWNQVETSAKQATCANCALFNESGMMYKMLEISKFNTYHELLADRAVHKRVKVKKLFIRPKKLGKNSTHTMGAFYMNCLTFYRDGTMLTWGPEKLIDAYNYKATINYEGKSIGVNIYNKYPFSTTATTSSPGNYNLGKINDKTDNATETGFMLSSMKTSTRGYGIEITFDEPIYIEKVLFHIYKNATNVLNGDDWELYLNDLEEPLVQGVKNDFTTGEIILPIEKVVKILHHPVSNKHYTIRRDPVNYLNVPLKFGTACNTTPLGSISNYNMSQGMNQDTANEYYAKNILLRNKVEIITKGFQEFLIPETGTWEFEICGADGGYAGEANSTTPWFRLGGRGAIVKGKANFNKNDYVIIVIGQSGWSNSTGDFGGGGGGFSALLKEDPNGALTFNSMKYTPIAVAGAGAGRTDEKSDNTNDVRNDDCPLNAKYLTSSLITETQDGANGGSCYGGAGIVYALGGTGISTAATSPHYPGFPGGAKTSYNGGSGGSGYHGGNASDSYPSYGGTSFWHSDLVSDSESSLREYSVEPPRHGYVILTYKGNS